MDVHKNARLTPRGRVAMVNRVLRGMWPNYNCCIDNLQQRYHLYSHCPVGSILRPLIIDRQQRQY